MGREDYGNSAKAARNESYDRCCTERPVQVNYFESPSVPEQPPDKRAANSKPARTRDGERLEGVDHSSGLSEAPHRVHSRGAFTYSRHLKRESGTLNRQH